MLNHRNGPVRLKTQPTAKSGRTRGERAMRLSKSAKGSRRGTIEVIVAVCSTVLLSFVAISVDGGVLMDEKRHAQSTADAAAMAAASVIYENFPRFDGKDVDGAAAAAAYAYAAKNGYTNDGTNSVVVVN